MKQSINLGRNNQSGEKQSIKLLEQEINKPLKENGAASQGRKSSPHKKPKKYLSVIPALLEELDEGSCKINLYKRWKTIHLN